MKKESKIQSILKGAVLVVLTGALLATGIQVNAQTKPKPKPTYTGVKKDTVKKATPVQETKPLNKTGQEQKPAAVPSKTAPKKS